MQHGCFFTVACGKQEVYPAHPWAANTAPLLSGARGSQGRVGGFSVASQKQAHVPAIISTTESFRVQLYQYSGVKVPPQMVRGREWMFDTEEKRERTKAKW